MANFPLYFCFSFDCCSHVLMFSHSHAQEQLMELMTRRRLLLVVMGKMSRLLSMGKKGIFGKQQSRTAVLFFQLSPDSSELRERRSDVDAFRTLAG